MRERPSGGHLTIDQLHCMVVEQSSIEALEELSIMAGCGNKRACKIVDQIEAQVAAGNLMLRLEAKPPSIIANVLFLLAHPVDTLKAKRRQTTVALELEAPPAGSTFENFPNLPLADAARMILRARREEARQKEARRKEKSGVPLNAWSKEDQKRLQRGKRPRGYPEHPNI